MIFRKYEPQDCKRITELFYNTVHTVNAKDYTKNQLAVWAPECVDAKRWNASLLGHITFVAVESGTIVGFGDIDKTGYLDRLYVHKDHQRRGIATEICDRLEGAVAVPKIITHASITARPFFEKRGYNVIKEQQIERQGVLLINYVMEKERPLPYSPSE